MDSFVDIKTFFSREEDRTVEKLSAIYDDKESLYVNVKELILKHMEPDDLKDKNVLLKPNFVRQNIKPYDPICLFTHPNLIFATLQVLLECKVKSITIGDAPIQNCDWDLMLNQDFYNTIDSLSQKYCVPIKVVDFRKVIFYHASNTFGKSKRTEDDYLIFDVANRSWLEPITKEKNQFRVTNYDPRRMALSHGKGTHKYCVAKEIFEADIVITMPKTKTHRMACITNSLKILVGMNGDKDYLPHHRIGSQKQGGDCYKDTSILRTIAERLLDYANKRRGSFVFKPTRKIVSLLWQWSKPDKETSMNAGWYGNDTVWRMVMDLNTIAIFGRKDGTLSETPQRVMYTLCDGIIGGQGSGPLDPDPLALGILSFSNDPYLMDVCMGTIFSLDIQKVPLLKEANNIISDRTKSFYINNNKTNFEGINNLKTEVELAPGWVDYKEF